jgi:hypothetical protein
VAKDVLWQHTDIISSLVPQHAIILGAILGEHYRRCISLGIEFHSPNMTFTRESKAQSYFISYNLISHQVTFQGPCGREKMHVLELAQSQEIRNQFSSEDAYQIGFYAGERLYHLKNLMRMQNDLESSANIIPFPG